MTTKAELTPDQASWVVEATHTLGSASPHPDSSTVGKLAAGDTRVSFLDLDAARNRRQRARALIFPREHGAWGLLLVPMVTGAGIAFRQTNNVAPFLWLLLGALALFWLRTPLESLLGTSAMRAQTKDERRTVAVAIAGIGAVALLALGELLWAGRNPLLWRIGAAAGVAFAGQALLKLMWRQPPRLSRQSEARRPLSKQSGHRLRMLSEIVGTIGLTAAAPAAYYVITGKFGVTAWVVWTANLDFRRRPDSLRAAQNSHRAHRGISRQAEARMGLCHRTSRDDGGAHPRLPFQDYPANRFHRLLANLVSRMVLFHPEARIAFSSPQVRLERTDPRRCILRSLHRNLCR